ncbi:tRNA 2-thiouridine(34) synthase MnmA [candidate division KSB1 bacterium]
MKIAVGLSGGVDSSVAAALLKKQGHEITGIIMKIWDGTPVKTHGGHACYGPDEIEDIEDARKVAEILDIPFHVIDLTEDYKKEVLEYFRKEYISGRTPNPCVICNRKIKFEQLVNQALISGLEFEYFATGHYARSKYDEQSGRYLLKKAEYLKKDQSYVLAFLSQEQLKRTLFPLGEHTKKEVREIAEELELNTFDRAESQDFFAGDYNELLNTSPKPGPILDTEGNTLGTHNGIWNYTIGQRKGLGISSDRPLYVLKIDKKKNSIVVGDHSDTFGDTLTAGFLNWISIKSLEEPMDVTAKIRYAQKEADALVTPVEGKKVTVEFKEKQFGITPGQVVVFYLEDIVVGAGIIENP